MTDDDPPQDGLTPAWRSRVMGLVAVAMVGVAVVVIYLLHRETFFPKWSSASTRDARGT
jgi:hypothetical protein